MRLSRRGTSGLMGGVSVLLLMLVCLSRALPLHTSEVPDLQPGASYAIPVTAGKAEFQLPRQQTSGALLIISSLASHETTTEVTVSAIPRRSTRQLPIRRIEPLRVNPANPDPSAYALRFAAIGPRQRQSPVAVSSRKVSLSSEAVTASRESQRSRPDLRPTISNSDQPPGATPRQRTFDIHVGDGPLDDPGQFVRVRADETAHGRTVRVFLDEQVPRENLAPGLIEAIVEAMDERILPAAERRLGPIRDIDDDGTVAVLLTPWLSRLQGGRTSLDGFVRTSDFRTDRPRPLSNQCDMLYLNSGLRPGTHLDTLLTHELTHAVAASLRTPGGLAPDGMPLEEDWLNEGLAHVMESLATHPSWSNLDYRVAKYLEDPRMAPLVVPDYHAANRWRDHGCRGATFLFLGWCVREFGDELPGRLLRGNATGCRNLELATGQTFAELYRRWTIAVAVTRLRPDGAMTGLSDDVPAGFRAGSGIERAAEHTLSLYGRLGKHVLTGPRFAQLDLDKAPYCATLRGTTTAYLELSASGAETGETAFPRQIRIAASPGARLQVTLIPLPHGLPSRREPTGSENMPIASKRAVSVE